MHSNETPLELSTSEKKARREALDAIETFEKTQFHGQELESDRWLLNELRRDENGVHLAVAWELIGKHRKNPDDDQLLIVHMFSAWHTALEAPAMLDAYKPRLEELKTLRECAGTIGNFFLSGKVAPNNEETAVRIEQGLQFLSWVRDFSVRSEHEISTLRTRLRLNRKLVGSSTDHERMRFTNNMCVAMLSIFNQRLDRAVAALATIVLPTEVTEDQVISADKRNRAG